MFNYNRRGIAPKNIESKFEIDELFFSTTDKKGIILSGNDVFIKVSKFPKDELFGKPHNIIRHPDMPRAVFKAVWDTIKDGKPFVGYVKNMAKDGSYYWVLAVIFPLFDKEGDIEKYLSIRLKPSSEYFKLIPSLYEKMKNIEIREGMEKALEYLIETLNSLGFSNYEEFEKKIFFEEMKSRQMQLEKEKKDKLCGIVSQKSIESEKFVDLLCSIQTVFSRLGRYFETIFSKVEMFLELNNTLDKKSKFIYELAEEIRLLSLNASIESYKIKKEGVSFSTLSQEMRKNAEYSEKIIQKMSNIIKDANSDIESIGFEILASKLQIEMILYFIHEMLEMAYEGNINEEEELEVLENITDLFKLLKSYTSALSKSVDTAKNKLRTIYYNLKDLNVMINRLDFIHINGLIESAHTGQDGGGFTIIFSQMLSLVEAAKKETINLEQNIFMANEENQTIDIINELIDQRLQKMQSQYEDVLCMHHDC
ncbi:PAS domain-containing methyl-accepting chemotaxis protein [Nitrosophilus alvini]|uniref:methyl-accepting chemotaxis protein n=1 Tax=Nitrosophilus alvini TaxID=2714855 RepID=UPI00190D56D4|nr:PAS domain-containing methyl-accepting chemotaxis protein [Nitrosophilus alvini]